MATPTSSPSSPSPASVAFLLECSLEEIANVREAEDEGEREESLAQLRSNLLEIAERLGVEVDEECTGEVGK